MKAILEDLIQATERYMEDQGTDTGEVDTQVTIFYQKGKGAALVSFVVPTVLQKYIKNLIVK